MDKQTKSVLKQQRKAGPADETAPNSSVLKNVRVAESIPLPAKATSLLSSLINSLHEQPNALSYVQRLASAHTKQDQVEGIRGLKTVVSEVPSTADAVLRLSLASLIGTFGVKKDSSLSLSLTLTCSLVLPLVPPSSLLLPSLSLSHSFLPFLSSFSLLTTPLFLQTSVADPLLLTSKHPFNQRVLLKVKMHH